MWNARIQTFAMSSAFLNSPLTSVTSPFSLTSVQRNFSSLDSFPSLLRPSTEPLPSFRKLGSKGRSFGLRVESPFLLFGCQNLLKKGKESVDVWRQLGVFSSVLRFEGTFGRLKGLALGGFQVPCLGLGLRKSRFRIDASTAAWGQWLVLKYRAFGGHRPTLGRTQEADFEFGVKKYISWVWVLRNRTSDEGADE